MFDFIWHSCGFLFEFLTSWLKKMGIEFCEQTFKCNIQDLRSKWCISKGIVKRNNLFTFLPLQSPNRLALFVSVVPNCIYSDIKFHKMHIESYWLLGFFSIIIVCLMHAMCQSKRLIGEWMLWLTAISKYVCVEPNEKNQRKEKPRFQFIETSFV